MSSSASALPPRTRLLEVGSALWRAVDQSGRALGNVSRETTPQGDRYRAMRFHAPSRAFRSIGEFWSPADAVESLRHGG